LEFGRYSLHHAIASGGMAAVHLGRMRTAAGVMRTVAIKRMHPHFLAEPDFTSMFLDEARLAMRIQHPNVVATFDVISADNELLLVMDFVLGESLDGLLRGARKTCRLPPVRVACSVIAGVLAGLHAAHEARDEDGEPLGIVHRDVSPQNVLVGVDGVPRVLDFGVAKAAGRLHTTDQGQVKGKLAYMAPEQLSSGKLDRRADVFAAAAVLWEALAGQRLFGADNPGATVANVLDKEVVAPSALNPDVPGAVNAIVLRGLSRHPDQRFASAREMAVALEEVCPPAPAREIGEWVEREAGDAVRARAALVADVESRWSSETRPAAAGVSRADSGASGAAIVGESSRAPLAEADGGTLTTSSVAEPARSASGRGWSRRRLTATAIGVASLFLAPLVLAPLVRSRVSGNGRGDPGLAVAWEAGRPPVPRGAPVAPAAPSTATEEPASSTAVGAASDANRLRGVTAATRVPVVRPPVSHQSAPRALDCSNPFTIGKGGIRVPRPECF
jgi:serine/threonine-protein kinase